MSLFNKFYEDPGVFIDFILGIMYVKLVCMFKNIEIGVGLKVIGVPMLDVRGNSKIIFGKNVILRSRNRGYHGNIHSPVKLMLDPGAVIVIGDNSRIYGSCIHSSKYIKIGKNCLIASNVTIIDRNGHDLCMDNPELRINSIGKSREIIIEDNVWIGTNCVITPGVTIGEGSVIMSNSVVNKSVNKFSLAGGVPCAIIKQYNGSSNEHTYI